jgi:hypothetical protein
VREGRQAHARSAPYWTYSVQSALWAPLTALAAEGARDVKIGLRIQLWASGILVALTATLLVLTLLNVPWIEALLPGGALADVEPNALELQIVLIVGIISTGLLGLASYDWLHARDDAAVEDAAQGGARELT